MVYILYINIMMKENNTIVEVENDERREIKKKKLKTN